MKTTADMRSDSFIASADAKVTVKATANGASIVYEPARDGEDFAIDIPVDVSRGAVATDLEVNAVRFDEQQDMDLVRQLSGRYTVSPNAANAMAYDADGNLLSHDGWTLAWNGENRLVQIEKDSHRETYDYDYMGRRFVKKVYGRENDIWTLASEEYFVYDGYRQIAAYTGAAKTLARTYAWDTAGLDTPLWTTDATGSYFYVADANKNIRMLFDEAGDVVAEYDYDPFGQVTATGDYAGSNPYRFSSEYHDDGTGLVYYNYRHYSPKLGRWISRDPIEEKGGESLYVTCGNNCIDSFDKLGLFLWNPFKPKPEPEPKPYQSIEIIVNKCSILVVYGHNYQNPEHERRGYGLETIHSIKAEDGAQNCAFAAVLTCFAQDVPNSIALPGYIPVDRKQQLSYDRGVPLNKRDPINDLDEAMKILRAAEVIAKTMKDAPCCCPHVNFTTRIFDVPKKGRKSPPTYLREKKL